MPEDPTLEEAKTALLAVCDVVVTLHASDNELDLYQHLPPWQVRYLAMRIGCHYMPEPICMIDGVAYRAKVSMTPIIIRTGYVVLRRWLAPVIRQYSPALFALHAVAILTPRGRDVSHRRMVIRSVNKRV